jgi:ABC-type transport system involved in cytochrome c biogenesis permease subunit
VLSLVALLAMGGELLDRASFRDESDPETEQNTSAAAPVSKPDARGRAMQHTAAVVKPLSNFIYRTMQVGVLLIAAGTILGGVWADYSWGRFWGWDPKEVWALITLLVYLIPLHGRFAGWVSSFGLVVSSVLCFLSVIMAWYGVNFVLGVGLHSYGFVEGGSQGSMSVIIAGVMAVPFAAAWRRYLGQRR